MHERRVVLPLDEENANLYSTSQIEVVPDKVSIAQAIAALSPKYRELLLLKYDNGYSDREIAQMLSITIANVRKTIQRAKGQLKRILDEQEAPAHEHNR